MNDSSVQNFSITSNNGEAYWKRSLGFLIIGIIGILANAFVIVILGSSAKIRQKLVNTLIIHQSFILISLLQLLWLELPISALMIHMAWLESMLISIATL